jgi:hypothetical protein
LTDEFAAALEGKAVAVPTVEEEDETISVVADDIAPQSRDFVLNTGTTKSALRRGFSH